MNRKQFLKKTMRAGLCGCGVALGFGHIDQDERRKPIAQNLSPADKGWIPELEQRMIKGAKSPAWRRVEESEQWIKALMEHMDVLLDPETRVRLLQACGRSCFIRAFGVAGVKKTIPEELDAFLSFLEKQGNRVQREGSVIIVTLSWRRDHQNPQGLILQDGYCMCPIVETGPPGLSPTYCHCSTGYVRESFERRIGKSVKVELLDSLKMGGKDCVFKITI